MFGINKNSSLIVSYKEESVNSKKESTSPIGKRKFDTVENDTSGQAIKYDVKKIILIQNIWRGKEVRSKVFLPREISHHLEPWLHSEFTKKRISEITLLISRVFLGFVYHQKHNYSCKESEGLIFPTEEVLSLGKKCTEKEKGFVIKIQWDIIFKHHKKDIHAFIVLNDYPSFGKGSYKCAKRAFLIETSMKCTTSNVERHPFRVIPKAYAIHFPSRLAIAVLKEEMKNTEIVKSLLTPGCPAKVALWKPVYKYVEGSLCDLEQTAVHGDFLTSCAKGMPIGFFPNCKKVHLGLENKLEVFMDVLTTLEYFHSNHFGHTDLKPENILLSYHENKKSCEGLLSDFGFSGYFSQFNHKITSQVNHWNDLIKVFNIRTSQTDIFGFGYSLGVILLQDFSYRNIIDFKSFPEDKLICNEICSFLKLFSQVELKGWFKDPSILDSKEDDKEKTKLIMDQSEKMPPELRNKLLVKIYIVKILKNLFVKDESLVSSFKDHEKEFAKTKDNYNSQVHLSSVIQSWKPDFPTATELKIQLNSLLQLCKGKLPPEELFSYKKVKETKEEYLKSSIEITEMKG